MAEISEALLRRLERLLSCLAERRPIQQAIIEMETGDRLFAWTAAMGEATRVGTPPTADTPFFLASIDKLLNATIAMRLSERRQLDLDARVMDYLPPSITRGLLRLGGTDSSDRLTVRHLLGHTSGLADWLEDRLRSGRVTWVVT